MNRSVFLVCALNCLVYFSPLFSSDLVQFPLGNSAWAVDITYTDTGSTASATVDAIPHPVKVVVTLVNDVRRAQITWSNGKVTNRWGLESRGLTVTDNPTNNSIYVISDANLILLSYGKVASNASDFRWLNPSTLVSPNPVSYRDKSCMHYKGTIPPSRQAPPMSIEAWIDKTTLLPVALQEGTALYVFTFFPTPTDPLVMPSDFEAAMERAIATSTPPKVIGTYR